MSELRTRMLRDMTVRGFSPRTHEAYVRQVIGLARYYRREHAARRNAGEARAVALVAQPVQRGHAVPVDVVRLGGGVEIGPAGGERIGYGRHVVARGGQPLPCSGPRVPAGRSSG
jgi:hypothetical protein